MSSVSRTYEHTPNGHVRPFVRRVATTSSNIPHAQMSLLTLALTDNFFELRDPNNSSSNSNSYLRYHVKINVKRN